MRIPGRSVTLAITLALAAPIASWGDDAVEMPDFLDLEEPRAQVLLLGTFHFKDAGHDGYKPKHDVDILSEERQREIEEILDLLQGFAPTKIAVEAKRSSAERLQAGYDAYLAGTFELPSNEIYQLGFRLARRMGHEGVHPVDADSRRYEPWVDQKKWARRHDQSWVYRHDYHKRFKQLYEWEDELKTRLPLMDYLLFQNSPERIRIGHGHYLIGGFKLTDGEEYPGADHLSGWWYDRNLRIFSNLMQLARTPDDRVLLIIGAGHLPILRHAALSAPELELVEVTDVVERKAASPGRSSP